MKNILALITFLFISSIGFTQEQTQRMVLGRCNLSQTGGSANHWRLSGNFTDGAGLYESSDINVGDLVFFTDGGIGFLLPIDTVISATPPSFTVSVNKTGITAISSVPTTNSALICRGTSNHTLIPFTANITDPDNQVLMEHTLYLIDSLLSLGGGGLSTYVTTDSFSTFRPLGPVPDSSLVLKTPNGNWWQKFGSSYTRRSLENGTNTSTILNVSNDTLIWNANLNNHVRLTLNGDSSDCFIAAPSNISSQFIGETFLIGITAQNSAVTVTWDTTYGNFDLTDFGPTTVPLGTTINYEFRIINDGGEQIRMQNVDGVSGGGLDTIRVAGVATPYGGLVQLAPDSLGLNINGLTNAASISSLDKIPYFDQSGNDNNIIEFGPFVDSVGANIELSRIRDADNDTKVQTEESADEDIIRFDVAGTEEFLMKKNANGDGILEAQTTAGNTFVGKEAAEVNASGGFYNTTLGYRTLKANTVGDNNTAIGGEAMRSNTTGNNNTAVGSSALYGNTVGEANTAIGSNAMLSANNSSSNVAIGVSAMNNANGAWGNTVVGLSSGGSLTTGDFNVAVGDSALYKATTGTGSVAIGTEALLSTTTGSGNVGLGYRAGRAITTQANNTLVGYDAGRLAITGNSTIVGAFAGGAATETWGLTAIGTNAAGAATTGNFTTAIGDSTLAALTTGSSNTAVGKAAGTSLTTGFQNVLIGVDAMSVSTTGNSNVVVGTSTATNLTGSRNTILGHAAQGGSTAWGNVVVGYGSGNLLTTGDFNTIIGDSAGLNLTTQTNAIALGYNAQPSASNQVALGNANLTQAVLGGSVSWTRGTGSPESVISAPVGSYYSRTDGAAGTSLYIKESGSGNTGWTPLDPSGAWLVGGNSGTGFKKFGTTGNASINFLSNNTIGGQLDSLGHWRFGQFAPTGTAAWHTFGGSSATNGIKINGSSNAYLLLSNSNSESSWDAGLHWDNGNTSFKIFTPLANEIEIQPGGTTALKAEGDGDVVIGTGTGNFDLDIQVAAQFEKAVYDSTGASGTLGQVFTSNGNGAAPTWKAATGGGIYGGDGTLPSDVDATLTDSFRLGQLRINTTGLSFGNTVPAANSFLVNVTDDANIVAGDAITINAPGTLAMFSTGGSAQMNTSNFSMIGLAGGNQPTIEFNEDNDLGTDAIKIQSPNSLSANYTQTLTAATGEIPVVIKGSATLDFASTAAGAVADLTITVTGAANGDVVSLGVPNGSVTATATYTAWVSGADTVTVRFSPKATEDPASGTFKVAVHK